MIYIIGISITFFLAFILLTKKEKSISDKIFFAWLCVTFVHLSLFALISTKEYLQFPYLLGLELPMPLLHGPLVFLYSQSLVKGKVRARNIWPHFIPYVLALASIAPFFVLSTEEKFVVYQNEGAPFIIQTRIIFWSIMLSGITYSILSLRLLVRHKRKIKDYYSYTEKINLQWLFLLIIGLSCIWLVVLLHNDEYVFTTVVLYVMVIGFFGIKQVGIFSNSPPADLIVKEGTGEQEVEDAPSSQNTKYEKSMLTDDQLGAIHADLVQLMGQKRLYLSPDLTLAMVAQELDVHPNTLSQVINRAEEKNFFDYVNTLRVEHLMARLAQPESQKFTLLSLAYECGFNSKTSFNRNFRNITGKSPSEYLKEIKVTMN